MGERRYRVYILVSMSGNAMYTKLVYAEEFETPADAIAREKQLKGWRRERKNDLVRTINPQFQELLPASPELQAPGPSPSAQDDSRVVLSPTP